MAVNIRSGSCSPCAGAFMLFAFAQYMKLYASSIVTGYGFHGSACALRKANQLATLPQSCDIILYAFLYFMVSSPYQSKYVAQSS